jgi:hypothetical protein
MVIITSIGLNAVIISRISECEPEAWASRWSSGSKNPAEEANWGGGTPTLLDPSVWFVGGRLQPYGRRPTRIKPGIGTESSLRRSLRQSRRVKGFARPLQGATGPGLDQEVHQGERNQVRLIIQKFYSLEMTANETAMKSLKKMKSPKTHRADRTVI